MSGQGVHIWSKLTVSCVGQADDVVLCSNDIYMLYNLLVLTLDFCKKFSVHLSADKTKLLNYSDKTNTVVMNPIIIDNKQINLSDEAEHVGIIRSVSGNLPNLLNRIHCSKKATNATLASGLARGHRSNPAACIQVMNMYGTPVLMSGLGSLVLNSYEINTLHQHHGETLRGYQKLHDDTPQAFIYFMAGSLPAIAILHLRQLSLFGMISRLPGDPLQNLAKQILITSKQNDISWFVRLCSL